MPLRILPNAGCVLAALAVACGNAFAQDLVQVYDRARAHDPAMQAAEALLRSAAPRSAQAEALLRPTLGASGSWNWARYDPSSSAEDPSGTRLDTRTSSAALTARQPLYNPAASADIALAHTAARAAEADFEVTLQDFILKVAQAYFDVLSAQDVLAATQASKRSIGGQLDAATRNYEAGTAVVTDRQDAQARFDLALSDEIAAVNDLRVKQLALDRLVGQRGISPERLGLPVATPADLSAPLEDWLRLAAQQPAVARAELALESAKLDVERARAAGLPTVNAVGSYGFTRVSGSGSAIASTYPAGRTTNTSVGIEVNVPLFAGLAVKNRVDETELLVERARDGLEAQRQAAADQTEHAFFDFQSGLAQVKALEAAELSSRSSVEGTRIAYGAGLRLNLDVLNAQTLLFQTERDLAKARYESLMRGLRLRAAAGHLQPQDLVAINRLLVH